MLMSPFADEVAQVVAEEKVAVVTTGAGNPSKYMKMWIEAGIKVIPVVASVSLAKLMQRVGATAVIAEGGESGGHVGELTTMALVPQVASAVTIPVIAAGGIGDGRGVAAAFMLGAVGVQLGTRFLVASECGVHQNYKNKVLKANDIATMTTGKRLGHPVRSIKNPYTKEYFRLEYSGISDEELEAYGRGALYRAAVEGDEKDGLLPRGPDCGHGEPRAAGEGDYRGDVPRGGGCVEWSGKMGKIAFVFSGQGAQYSGMGKSLYEASPAAKAVFDTAEQLRPGTIAQCFESPVEELSITKNTQPCLFCVDLAAAAAAARGGRHGRRCSGLLARRSGGGHVCGRVHGGGGLFTRREARRGDAGRGRGCGQRDGGCFEARKRKGGGALPDASRRFPGQL